MEQLSQLIHMEHLNCIYLYVDKVKGTCDLVLLVKEHSDGGF